MSFTGIAFAVFLASTSGTINPQPPTQSAAPPQMGTATLSYEVRIVNVFGTGYPQPAPNTESESEYTVTTRRIFGKGGPDTWICKAEDVPHGDTATVNWNTDLKQYMLGNCPPKKR